jgi:hypothetical protein
MSCQVFVTSMLTIAAILMVASIIIAAIIDYRRRQGEGKRLEKPKLFDITNRGYPTPYKTPPNVIRKRADRGGE